MQNRLSMCVSLLVTAVLLGIDNAYSFNTTSSSWTSSSATFRIGNFPANSGVTINDNVTNAQIRQAFIDAMESWNGLSRFEFTANTSSTLSACSTSGNGAIFRNTQCSGSAFGGTTLAITTITFNPNTDSTIKTGIAFNNTKAWGVYSGAQQGSRFDFRRVAVHELGHALGLAHEDTQGSSSTSPIMRSFIGSTEVPQDDDTDGIIAIYGPLDSDNDGVNDLDGNGNSLDNCRFTPNTDQQNSDSDSLGNACDNCPNNTNQNQADLDGDGDGDACDNDIDGDNVLNGGDSNPTNNRICGIDADDGGNGDGCDDCASGILDQNNDGTDTDGDGICNVGDPDDDGDGVSDNFPDNCPLISNPGQEDVDMNGIGDVCDDLCLPIRSSNSSIAVICL